MNERIKDKEAWRRVYLQFCKTRIPDNSCNLQNVFTPYGLCKDIIGKLESCCGSMKGKTFLVFNLEFVEVLCYNFGVPLEWILFVTDCKEKIKFTRAKRYKGLQTELMTTKEFLEGEWDMKFDCVVMNPPYQTKSDESHKKTQPLWHKFVLKALDVIKEDGYLCAVHPSGWRNAGGVFQKVRDALDKIQMHFLSIHNRDEGQKTFGCTTRYDWYVAQKKKPTKKTAIEFEDGKLESHSLQSLEFIPNGAIKSVKKLIAKKGEDAVEILYSSSAYESRKPHMSKTQTDEHKYPCIQQVGVSGEPTCMWYSSTNENGHFGIAKVIFSSALSGGTLVDSNGDYATCQHCASIVDNKKNLSLTKQAMDSDEFITLMKMCNAGGLENRYPQKVIATFRKDFWKEFV